MQGKKGNIVILSLWKFQNPLYCREMLISHSFDYQERYAHLKTNMDFNKKKLSE
jgi:hypothetical protein